MARDAPTGEPSFAEGFAPADESTWRAAVSRGPRGLDPDALARELVPGIDVPPVAFQGPDTLPSRLRGRAGRGWQVCQEITDPRMEVAAAQAREDLRRGADALWLVAGLEHGCRMLTPGDLDLVLAGVDLDAVPLQLEPEADALGLAGALFAVAESRGVTSLRGGLGADPLGALLRSGSLFSGLGGGRRDLVSLAAYCAAHRPGLAAALVQTRALHDAGATPTDELAWALATGVTYLRWMMEDASLDVDAAAAQVRFSLGVQGQTFVEIAKLRALRVLWAKAVAAAGGAPASQRAFVHARTSGSTATRVDAWNDMVRRTAETFAAAVGGADSIACAPFDEAMGPADALARRVARNTQLVLRDEAHLGRVDDPAGGSWALERLTDALARAAWDRFRAIEARGGMARAVAQGDVAFALEQERRRRRTRLETRAEAVVGVSLQPTLSGRPVVREAVDLQAVEVELGNAFGDATPDQRHGALLKLAQGLVSPGWTPAALVDDALDAARLGVDLYSIGAVLRARRASLHVEPLVPFRAAAPFEALRAACDAREVRPSAVVLHVGPLSEHGERLGWVQGLLAAAGIEGRAVPASVEDAVAVLDATLAEHGSGASVVLCASDARYDALVPMLAPHAKAKGARVVAVAGSAPDDAWARLGVDLTLHRDGNVYRALRKILELTGLELDDPEDER
ncbi:MAG: methylmalonyl-CoA mutase family protein [Myxococcota bacterium]